MKTVQDYVDENAPANVPITPEMLESVASYFTPEGLVTLKELVIAGKLVIKYTCRRLSGDDWEYIPMMWRTDLQFSLRSYDAHKAALNGLGYTNIPCHVSTVTIPLHMHYTAESYEDVDIDLHPLVAEVASKEVLSYIKQDLLPLMSAEDKTELAKLLANS